MSFGGGKKVVVGYRYFMTLGMGLCRGPIDEIKEITIGGRKVYPYPAGVKQNYDIDPLDDTIQTRLDAPKLFGGDKREGGVVGRLNVYMGKRTQSIADRFKELIGGRVPDFRGVVTVWFDGMICAINPYPKEWKFRVRRTTAGWDGPVWREDLCVIWLKDHQIKAMNPAHILYETATNYDWGRGLSRNELDDEIWTDTARQLKQEKFGLCLKWSRDGDLDVFVSEILKHIGGTIYTDRETGLLCLRLIRKDYKYKNLRLYTYDSGLLEVGEDSSLMPDKTINEVVVKYRDPIKDGERMTRAQNLALIHSTGSRNSSEPEYTAIPTFGLASRVAQRDLRALAVTQRFTLKLDRRAWDLYPGKAFRISAPDKGIVNAILRAGKIDYGTLKEGAITVEAVLDVFALSSAEFVNLDLGDEWELPPVDAQPITVKKIREFTYYDFITNADRYTFDNLGNADTALAVFAERPFVMANAYTIYTRAGSAAYREGDTVEYAATGLLTTAVTAYETSLTVHGIVDGESFDNDMLIEIDDEIMLVKSYIYDEDALTASMVVARGVLDTIPYHHGSNSRWFIVNDPGNDSREWIRDDDIDVKLTSITPTTELDLGDAATNSYTFSARQSRPYPPAKVKINNTWFFDGMSASDPTNLMDLSAPINTMTVTWNFRDRVIQSDVIVDHDEDSVGPEDGVVTRCMITTIGGTVLYDTDHSDDIWVYNLTALPSGANYYVILRSKRSSLESEFEYKRRIHR